MRTVGYSKSIQLGSLGRMLENPREVLRIQFLDAKTRQPYDVVEELYLRGALLTDYRRGRWSPWQRRDPERRFREVRRRPLFPGETQVLQEITLQPLDQPEVFCVWPFQATRKDRRRILYDVEHDRLLRAEQLMSEVTAFELGTTGLVAGRQMAITPCEADEVMDTDLLLQMPADWQTSLRGLTALAARWMQESPLSADDRYARAVLLERRLRDSGQFQYSMESQNRDFTLDPAEDFVTKHPRGHCEYFATALALMLRSQGYPARVVIGFKSDEWNRMGHFCTVRQLHAHTWVEVYLEPNHLPPGTRLSQRDQRWTNGGWLRLDATPSAEDSQAGMSLLKRADGWLTWLDYAWDSYVMQMDSPKQREAIYDPLGHWLTATARRLVDPGWWRRVWQGARQWVATRWQSLREQGWAGWKGITLIGGLLATLGLGVVALGYLWRRRAGRRPVQGPSATASLARVRFYRRLETILARHGLARPEGQTQREFARHAGQQLANTTGEGQLADLPVQVAEAFYRVRFGGMALDKTQSEAVEQALLGLEHAGASRPGRSPP